jgi:Sec7-like guanine-nucleotide exchange factor
LLNLYINCVLFIFFTNENRNDFSQLVADEYLKLFNFQSLTLDAALRKFLKQFQLVGDAQEKERVLLYFAKRYVDANNTAFTDVGKLNVFYI